ncbi:MAG: hypothetical protein JWO13_3209 [Acidobacteriales bacterium]|nr:hypothetical protein [Terriglobales bacterium]
MSPRRVLHLLGSSGHEGTGIARIASTLALGIDPNRYSTSVYFFGQPGPLSHQFQQTNIPATIIKWRHPSRDPIGLFTFWNTLRKESFDIIHVHWGGRFVRALAQRTGAKVILHLHGSTGYGASSTANADAVIAVSKAVAASSSHINTKVVYSGVEVQNAASPATSGSTIGFAGRLETIKGVTYLLQALHLLRPEFPDLRLELAGSGQEEANLRREVAALGLSGSVEFLGWVQDLRPTLLRWTIFAQPSLDEGIPLSLLEGMSAGLPVVASNVGGIPEAVQDCVTGRLVSPADPAALAECIRGMLADSSATQKMGEAGRLRVQHYFSSPQMVESVARIYDELLAL